MMPACLLPRVLVTHPDGREQSHTQVNRGHPGAASRRGFPCVPLPLPQVPVIYPFGHGLSYTSWQYSELSVTAALDADLRSNGTGCYDVGVTVSNTGRRPDRWAQVAASVCLPCPL